jgi:hypothetical protein
LTDNERRAREQTARYAPRIKEKRNQTRTRPSQPVEYREEELPEKAYIEEGMVIPEGDAAYYELIDLAGEEVDADIHGNDEEVEDENDVGANFGSNEEKVVEGRLQRERKQNPKFYGEQWVNYTSLAKGDAFLALSLDFVSPPKSHQAKLFGLLAQNWPRPIPASMTSYTHLRFLVRPTTNILRVTEKLLKEAIGKGF